MSNLELQLLCNLGADDKTETTNCFHLLLFTEFPALFDMSYINSFSISEKLLVM